MIAALVVGIAGSSCANATAYDLVFDTSVESKRLAIVLTSGSTASLGGVLIDLSTSLAPPGIPPIGSAVPEPATWIFMLLGFAAIGGALRRSRQPDGERAVTAGLQ